MTCHFSISNVRFAFWAFFSKTGKKLGFHAGSKWWPHVTDDPLTRWPNDPVPCLVDKTNEWRMNERSIPLIVKKVTAADWVVIELKQRYNTALTTLTLGQITYQRFIDELSYSNLSHWSQSQSVLCYQWLFHDLLLHSHLQHRPGAE